MYQISANHVRGSSHFYSETRLINYTALSRTRNVLMNTPCTLNSNSDTLSNTLVNQINSIKVMSLDP